MAVVSTDNTDVQCKRIESLILLMSDTDRNNSVQPSAATRPPADSGEGIPVSKFEVVPYHETANQGELYSYRAVLEPPSAVEEPPVHEAGPPIPVAKILLLAGALAGIALLLYSFPAVYRPRTPVSYVDLGSQRFDPAGLSGRLILRWEASASYQLYLDPEDQAQTARFAAMAKNPPRQLSITLHLRDAEGLVACQKQILFPAPGAQAEGGQQVSSPAPEQTPSGDTERNLAGKDGQIGEIDVRGPLPCAAKAYASISSWDFFTDFPSLAEQDQWLKREKELNARKAGSLAGLPPRMQRLPAPIEGDDVIVGDNPTRGTVDTSSGHVFYLGAAGMSNRTAEWQVFPAPIHFRCEKNGVCTLTHASSHAALQARLVQ